MWDIDADMNSMYNKTDILKWLSENEIRVNDVEDKLDEDSLRAVSLCIDFCNSLKSPSNNEKDPLVDEEDEIVDVYSDYNFYGKVGLPIFKIKDIIKSFIAAIVKSKLSASGSNIVQKLVINGALPFLLHLEILPNTEQRCVFLRILILSDGLKEDISLKQIEEFTPTENYVKRCPFFDVFECKRVNMEDSSICSEGFTIEETIKKLSELRVVEYDKTQKKVLKRRYK